MDLHDGASVPAAAAFEGPDVRVLARPLDEALLAFADELAADEPVSVELELSGARLGKGDRVLFVGSRAALGDLDPDRAPAASREDGRWVARAELRSGRVVAFKPVIRRADGRTEWAPGDNRYAWIRPGDETLRLQVAWEV